MTTLLAQAPHTFRSMLLHEHEKRPELGLHELCHRVEGAFNRKDYHALLAWADAAARRAAA
jgi:hypothetical protein